MKNKKGFTLMEIVLVIVIIGIALTSIIYYIQSTLKQVHQANQKIIAMNLAKEGMESVYYARNQRVLAHSGIDLSADGKEKLPNASSNRTKCWLALDTSKCPSDLSILGKGNYTFTLKKDTNGGGVSAVNIIFSKQNKDISLKNGNMLKSKGKLSAGNKPYALYLSGDQWTTVAGSKTDNLTRYGRFFRKIVGKGIYKKTSDGDIPLNCGGDYNNIPDCHNNTPKEYRFCSVVKYVALGSTPSEVSFCGLITNFFPNVNQEG